MITRVFNQKCKLLVLGSTLFLGVIIYSNTFYSSFHLDDACSIVDNLFIRNIFNPRDIWNFWPTRFVTYLSIALNYHLSGLNVLSYHIFNLIIHLSSAILVWWFILLTFSTPRMIGKRITKDAKLVAFFVTFVFTAHPIQTQGVTYIIQRAVSLTTLFYILSLCLYVKSRLLQEQGKSLATSRIFYCGSLISVVMAMFSKEMAITLPFMILLYEATFLRRKEGINWRYLIPFLATLSIIPLIMFLTKSVDFMAMRRAIEEPANMSSWQYLLTQFRVMVTYLRLLFVPINQNFDYYYPVAKSLFELSTLASFILLFSVLTIAVKVFSEYRIISFGIFWVFLTLLPESSVIPIKDVIFEHRLYLPMVGFSLFAVSFIYYFFEHKSRRLMIAILLVIISCYSVLTYIRNFIWQDELTLWSDVMRKSPNKARPYNNRGVAYDKLGNFIQAVSDYNEAIARDPNSANAYNNRGVTCGKQGNSVQAISDYSKAIAINPNYANAYNNRGVTHYNQGNFIQSISDHTKAIKIDPNHFEAYNNRGVTYGRQNNLIQAVSDYTKAIRINPIYANSYYNRGLIYYQQGDFIKAVSDYDKAIRINPNYANAYTNRGSIYYQQGKLLEAISDYNKAIEIIPNHLEAYINRGDAYDRLGNFTQAIFDYTKAISISPDYAKAYYNRAGTFFILKEYEKAWEDLRKAEVLGSVVELKFLKALKKALRKNK